MAIATMDQLVAGLANGFRSSFYKPGQASVTGWFSWWVQAGYPGPAVTPPSGAGEAPTEATAGAMAYVNATSPARNYLAAAEVFGQSSGYGATLCLYDRLVHTSGLSFTTTASQTVNSAAITRPDSSGAGTELFLEVYANVAGGAGGTLVTVSYTNQSGVSGRTGTSPLVPASSIFVGTLFPISLAPGDTGVRSVQSVSLTPAGAFGSFGVTIGRRLAHLGMIVTNTPYSGAASDAFALGLPALESHACLWPVSLGNNPGPPIGALISVAAG